MKFTEGSEKQIAWATDIHAAFMDSAKTFIELTEAEIAKTTEKMKTISDPERVASRVESMARKTDSIRVANLFLSEKFEDIPCPGYDNAGLNKRFDDAEWWINRRNHLDSEAHSPKSISYNAFNCLMYKMKRGF